ncbi:putative membrane protein [Fodinibius salinus]|uniref:Putative membrane protein n=1 Tax=Fodinibius salinus TaxID=860790 RepID=A0A5D3YLA4_9BACT|nr:DUF2207 domain-containing protein [Fodinibius salinus]TYP94966.1 putative membrane protein [Fodinibius salinus]
MRFKSFVLSIILLIVGFTQSSAKSYEIPKIQVEVTIDENGHVHVTEHLTYTFDGEFSWAEYKLPRRGYTAITNIQISEGDTSYINLNTEENGTFNVARNEDHIRFKWYYDAKDEKRTFTISYTLKGAITIGPNWSQFFWNYLSNDRDKSTNQLDIAISLPQTVAPDSLYAWSRGFGQNINIKQADGRFSVNVTNIDEDTFAKVRTVFPTVVFDLSKISVNDTNFSLAQAEKEEQDYQQQLAEEKKREAYLADLWGTLNYFIALLSIGILYFLYHKYGKPHSTSRFSSQETIMAPDNTPPAAVGWLLQNRSITANLLMSTVLDLARRGYFTIQEQTPEEGSSSDNNPTFSIERTDQPEKDELKIWERQLLKFIEQRIADGDQKLDKLFDGGSSDLSKWYTSWKNNFKDYCYDKGWIDTQSYTGVYWNIALQFILLGPAIASVIFAGPLGLISVITCVIAFILSFGMIRRTPEGEETYHQWHNYKKGLENARNYSLSSDKLGRHFIYGVAFGLEEEHIEHIVTNPDGEIPAFIWISFSNQTNSPAAVASSFSTLSATGTASFGSVAGGVAGASASTAGGGAAASAG